MNNITELLAKKEELHPELKPYIVYSEMKFPMLKHPLIFSLFYIEAENAMLNMRYKVQKERLEKYLDIDDITAYVFTYERPYRLSAFKEYIRLKKVTDDIYWSCLGSIWSDSENIWQEKRSWKHLLSSKRTQREFFMSPEEREIFSSLPETFTVYRGHQEQNEDGYSYTLSDEKAKWFAERFKSKSSSVIEKVVNKSEVFAYLHDRNEQEIIIIK